MIPDNRSPLMKRLAAVNILAEGRRNFAPAMGENRRGDGVRPKRSSAKASIVETLNPLLTVKG